MNPKSRVRYRDISFAIHAPTASRPLNQLAILNNISCLKRCPRNWESFPLLLDMVDSVSSNPLRSTKGVTHVHAAH
jgi:hypothetical protein